MGKSAARIIKVTFVPAGADDAQTFEVRTDNLPGKGAAPLPFPAAQGGTAVKPTGPMAPARALQLCANGTGHGAFGVKADDRLAKWKTRKMTVAQARTCKALAEAHGKAPLAAYWQEVIDYLAPARKARKAPVAQEAAAPEAAA